jgi:hypothetical protein
MGKSMGLAIPSYRVSAWFWVTADLPVDHSSVYPLLVFGRSVFLICLVSRGFNL